MNCDESLDQVGLILFSRQQGWLLNAVLWLLAGVGLITLIVAAIAVRNYAPTGEATAILEQQIGSMSSSSAGSAEVILDHRQQQIFDRTCGICHTQAGSGAPLSGDVEAWTPRVAAGMDVLLERTLKGYQAMPPMGLCMDCSRSDFVSLIAYMGQFSADTECEE